MFLAIFAFCAGLVVGAFSHKWIAGEVKATTGVDPQALADQAKAAVSAAKKG